MHSKKPFVVALGAVFALTGASGAVFAAQDLASGYQLASLGDKAAEAKCGAAMKAGEASCGGKAAEATCGGDKAAEGTCGAAHHTAHADAHGKVAEHKCGEGRCGAAHKPK